MIALIDYGAGNLTSVRKALAHLDAPITTPGAPAELAGSDGLIVPGVGHFESTAALHGSWTAAIRACVGAGTPLLGICIGLQWLFDGSAEAPDSPGLGQLAGSCVLLPSDRTEDGSAPARTRLKIPHVGWNSLEVVRPSWILDGIPDGAQVYFTHSYAAPVTEHCVAATTYGARFASVVERDAVAGVQFHPEKSGDVGLAILRNFLRRVEGD